VLPLGVMGASGVAVLLLAGFGGGWPARAGSLPPPTHADFVGDPSCMLYELGADLRIRVRAPRAAAACARLSRELARSGLRWSVHARRARRILSPICLFADPGRVLELEAIDDAANSHRGARICAKLARAGWFDFQAP
jgi:hypothetical protein